jgi:hypothetical protein
MMLDEGRTMCRRMPRLTTLLFRERRHKIGLRREREETKRLRAFSTYMRA